MWRWPVRTFIAIEVPCDFIDELARLSRQLACTVPGRFMRRETYHLTLAFLGEIGEMESHLVIEAMDEVAGDGRPPRARSYGLGARSASLPTARFGSAYRLHRS